MCLILMEMVSFPMQIYRICRILIPSIPDFQLQRLVDRVLIEADNDRDGRLSFEEFSSLMVENTPDVFEKLTISWE